MTPGRSDAALRVARPLLFALCLLPLALLIGRGLGGGLGSNPVETVIHTTGDWTLRLLLATLAVTPLQRMTGQAWVTRLRRPLGLFAFVYGSLHLMTYLWLEHSFDWTAIAEDVFERPYVTVGFAAFALMLPLALTSTRAWVRRLGRRWRQLHRIVYLVGALGVLHYLWLVKADVREPVLYGAILVVLMAFRLPWVWRNVCRSAARAQPISERR